MPETIAWVRASREGLGWSTRELADQARQYARAQGDEIKLTQQSISGLENGNLKNMPFWIRYVRAAIKAAQTVQPAAISTSRDEQAQYVQMTVALPSAAALSRMFEGLLAPLDMAAPKAELAELLARRLPIGLAQVQGPLIEHDPDDDHVPGEAPPPPSPAHRASAQARRT